jgi:hypothetical protein
MRRHRRRPHAGTTRPFSMTDKDRMEVEGRGNGGEEKAQRTVMTDGGNDGWRK